MTNLFDPDTLDPGAPDRGDDTEVPAGGTVTSRPCPFPWAWPGIRLGWQDHYTWYAGAQNAVLVLGPPRSGKTTGIVAPAVTHAPGPVVSTSTKADLAALTLAARNQMGRCWFFDPSGTIPTPPGCVTARWSPVPGCELWQTAIGRAHALAGTTVRTGEAAHWVERAEALLAPLLHAAALVGLDMIWPLRWILRRDLSEALTALARYRGHDLAADVLQGVAETDERERSGIFSTAARILAAYRNPAALHTASDSNFDPAAFVHSQDTLYLVAPSHDQEQLAPIVVALLDHIRSATYQRHPSWPPTLFALDEAANIAPLPDLPAILAEGAGQGLLTLTCLQDLNQARHRWGSQAEGFLTLHGVKIALGGIADTATLRALSYLAGSQDITWTTRNGHRTGLLTQPGWSQIIQQRPRIPPETINQMPPGVAYLAHTTWTPRLITTRPPAPAAQPDQHHPSRLIDKLAETARRWLDPAADNPRRNP